MRRLGPEGFRAILLTRVGPDLRQRLGVTQAAAALGLHDELFSRCLERCQGHAEEREGDGFVATFALPSQALRCALDFQQGLTEVDLVQPLSVGMAIHVGEIVGRDTEAGRLRCPALETAERVLGLAEASQILLTEVAFDAGRQEAAAPPDQPPLEWLAHGPYLFEGLESPLPVFEVGVAELSLLRPPQDTDMARRSVVPGEDETLGWRPARGLPVPGRPHWLLEERLGEGGFGEVWRASHEKTKEKRAFKFCFDPQRVRGLQREVVLFRLLKETLGARDDIAQILDWQFDEAPYFLEVEHTEGGDLAHWAQEHGGLTEVPLETRLEIAAEIATALAAAHGVGVLHKDVKPANILISENADTGEPHAVLTDFGIGLVTDRDALVDSGVTIAGFTKTLVSSSSGSGTGTPVYMAPEVLEGRPATIQSDIYSLGVVLYQLLAGDFSRVVAPGWERGVEDELLREDIAACVDGDPERRLVGAGDLVRRLRNLDERRAEQESEARAREEAVRAKRRRRVLAMTSLAGLVLSVLVALVAWRESAQRRQAEEIQYVASVQFAGAALERRKFALARGALERTPQRLRGWEWEHLVDQAWPEEPPSGEPKEISPGESAAEIWDGAGAVVVAKRKEDAHSLTLNFDRSGKRLLITAGNTVKLWDIEAGAIVFERKMPAYITLALMSADDTLLAVGVADQTAAVWEVETGEIRHLLTGHQGSVDAPFFGPDDSLMVTVSLDYTQRVWDAETGAHLRTLDETRDNIPVLQVVYLDENRVLLPSSNQSVRVWNLQTGKPESVVQGPAQLELIPEQISPGGKYVLSTSWHKVLDGALIWSAETGQELYTIPMPSGDHGRGLGYFSQDDSAMALLFEEDGTLHFFEVESGRALTTLTDMFENGRWHAWSPDGARLAVAQFDGTVFVLAPTATPPAPRDVLVGHSDWVAQVVWSRDSARLATASVDHSVVIWDVPARTPVTTLDHPQPVYWAEFSPTGEWIWTSTFAHHRIWNARTGELELEQATGFPAPRSPRGAYVVYPLIYGSDRRFSPDGTRLVLPFTTEARVLDAATGETLLRLPGVHDFDGQLYGPRGAHIFTVSEKRMSVTVWDADDGERLRVLEAPSSFSRVEVSPDGTLVLAGSLDGVLHLWDVETGSEVHAIQADETSLFAAFDATGTRALTHSWGGNTRLWSVSTGELLAEIEGAPGPYQYANVSPDGTRILKNNGDLFDLEGNLLVTLKAAGFQARWSPNGRTIAGGYQTGEVQLWDSIPWPELRDLGGSSLDLEERVSRRRTRGSPDRDGSRVPPSGGDDGTD